SPCMVAKPATSRSARSSCCLSRRCWKAVAGSSLRARRDALPSGLAPVFCGLCVFHMPGGGGVGLAHDCATQFFLGIRRQQRTIVTPEGVPVTVELADHGERMTAFAIDVFIWFLLTILVYLPLVFFALGGKNSALIGLSIVLFVGFVVRNLYFIHFE